MYRTSSPQALELGAALEKEGIILHREKYDGFKHIDIAIPRARLNIEVDGIQHYDNADQILADLDRTHYSALKGFETIRIPNALLKTHLATIATAVAKAAQVRAKKIGHAFRYRKHI